MATTTKDPGRKWADAETRYESQVDSKAYDLRVEKEEAKFLQRWGV